MLLEFKVTNFRSIRETQILSLVASNSDKDLPQSVIDTNLVGLAQVKLLKGTAIYGANASGKSNFIQAVNFVTQLVKGSVTRLLPGESIEVEPFKLDESSSAKPSEFEVTFVANEVRYCFGLVVEARRVLEEYLMAYPKGKKRVWYHRRFRRNSYEWKKGSTDFEEDKSLQQKTRENALFLSVAAQFNHPQLTQIFEWFSEQFLFLDLGYRNAMHPVFTADLVSEKKYRERILSLLRSADLGVVDVQVQKEPLDFEELKKNASPSVLAKIERKEISENGRGVKLQIQLAHGGSTKAPVLLNFLNEESLGTQRFFALLGPWIKILESGATVFVDELETHLHPLLVKELLRLIFSKKNEKGAQIIFTTHNPVFLDHDLMRRDQVWFTEKDSSGATRLYPLTDYKPRKEEALLKGYLAGRYGAIPDLPEGLK